MPNGNEALNDAVFENQINELKGEDLIKFSVRQTYAARKEISEIGKQTELNRKGISKLKILVFVLFSLAVGGTGIAQGTGWINLFSKSIGS